MKMTKNDRMHKKSLLQMDCNSTFVCDTAARSIRKQEAALMLGNGDDFHLGD